MTTSARKALTTLLLAVVAVLLLNNTPALADNSKDANHVMVCVATYTGTDTTGTTRTETERVEMAILDKSFDEQSMRTMLVERVLIPHFAASFHHEWYDYPNPPKTVKESDLDSVKCRVSHTNKPLEP